MAVKYLPIIFHPVLAGLIKRDYLKGTSKNLPFSLPWREFKREANKE